MPGSGNCGFAASVREGPSSARTRAGTLTPSGRTDFGASDPRSLGSGRPRQPWSRGGAEKTRNASPKRVQLTVQVPLECDCYIKEPFCSDQSSGMVADGHHHTCKGRCTAALPRWLGTSLWPVSSWATCVRTLKQEVCEESGLRAFKHQEPPHQPPRSLRDCDTGPSSCRVLPLGPEPAAAGPYGASAGRFRVFLGTSGLLNRPVPF